MKKKTLVFTATYNEFENIQNFITAVHNNNPEVDILIIDDNSSCKFTKVDQSLILKKGIKIIKKNIVFDKNYWKINISHDGYLKSYNSIH